MRQLAAELGVSPMTPYRYFADKEAILAAVRARAFDRHADSLESAFRETEGGLFAKTRAVGQAYIRFALDNPEAYRLMFDARQENEGAYPELVRAASRSHATMTAHLRELKASGHFDGDIEFVGHMHWAAIHGPIMLHLSGMLPQGIDAARLAEAIIDTLDGLRPPLADPA